MTDHDSRTVSCDDVELENGVLRILTLQRPDERNPLDGMTLRRLRGLYETAHADARVRVVVITGAGPAFSAGGDLRSYLDLYRDPSAFRAYLDEFRALNSQVERGQFVSVAMVNGACVAGGLELALACDLMTIAEEAMIGDGHIRTGQIAGAGGSQRLIRAVGLQRAKQLLLSGRVWTGTEAVEAGLALFSAPRNELRDRTLELAEELASFSPLAIHKMKHLIGLAGELPFEAALDSEINVVVDYASRSLDAWEGLNAFLEGRPSDFTGS